MRKWSPFVIALCCLLLVSVASVDGRVGTIAYYYLMPSSQAMPPTPPPAPFRAVFYPVRTSCNQPCPTQNRYRWNYRPPHVTPLVQTGSAAGSHQAVSNVLSISYPVPRVNSANRVTTTSSPEHEISASTSYPTLSASVSHPKSTESLTTLPTPPPYTQNLPTKRPNPCPSGTPLLSENNNPMTCNFVVQPNGGCPNGDYWCHTGSSFETTTCCPNNTPKRDRCTLERANGDGDEVIPRWYFDIDLHKCRRFLYRGMRGNANNFITSIGCIERCERSDRAASVTKNPCGSGPPARDLNGELFLCVADDGTMKKERRVSGGQAVDGDPYRLFSSKSTSLSGPNNVGCPAGYYCHVGETSQTTTCCELSSDSGGDVCALELKEGEGGADLARWHFNRERGECVEFSYKGTKGNENNFLTPERCEAACRQEEEYISNPCSNSEMLVEPSGRPRHCNASTPCPVNYWCHRGATPETTVCCTGARRACDLPLAEGNGKAVLSRWYYDKEKQGCRKFLYSGVGGNQNSYITEDECVNACPANDNPCSSGQPLMVDNQPKVCSPQHRCPGTHFCHISAPEIPNYCCPKSVFTASDTRTVVAALDGDPCEHPMSQGIGPYAIPRYFFDRNTRRCIEFLYRGAKGNANNFLSIEDCQIVCQGFKNPCRGGLPFLDTLSNDPIICGGEQHCPEGYFCHVGSGPETTNCCPGTQNACELPIEVGGGKDQLERWGYDGGVQVCRQFTYSGMKGNEHCAQACNEVNPCLNGEPLTNPLGERVACRIENSESCPSPSRYFCHAGSNPSAAVCCPRSRVTNVCDLPMNYGTGGASLTRWHYNKLRSECESFQYNGIRGNENNFISREACERACGLSNQRQPLCPHGAALMDEKLGKPVECGPYRGCPTNDYVCHSNVERDAFICCENPAKFCLQPRDPGHCSGDEERYGYNPLTDSCVPYKYTGCGGSLNNFNSLEKCTEICCREYRLRMREESKG